MYVDLACGRCESSLALDAGEEMETFSLDLIHRFTKAHEECGYMAPSTSESLNNPVLRPRNSDDTQ